MPSTIRDLTELTGVASDDYILISDTSDAVNRDKRISKINFSGGLMSGGGLVQTQGFTITAPATGNIALKAFTPLAGRIASWLDGNFIQDGGFAVSDIARLSVAQTYTASMTVPFITSQSFALATDTATSFLPPISPGAFIISTDSILHLASALCVFRSTGSRFVQSIASQANVLYTAGALTGTTGTAGKFTISVHSDGKLYFENRLTTTTNCRLLFVT